MVLLDGMLYQMGFSISTIMVKYAFWQPSCRFSSIKNLLIFRLHIPTAICKSKRRVLDHNVRDTKSHLVKHAIEKCHKYPKIEDFNVIGKGHRNNTFKWKVAETFLIKDLRPTLNTHKKSVPLKLFN